MLIAGPTAGGKSALALAIAERDGGCLINADALQVYACWRVLTARPDARSCARAPHLLYGHRPCDAPYSVGAWLREAGPVIAEAVARGVRPVIVGGTGLYFDALTQGLAAIPAIPAAVRARSQAVLDADGSDALIADLARDDPETLARIDRANPMRVQRAWEVLVATGRGLDAWRRDGRTPILSLAGSVHVVAEPENIRLNSLIQERFFKMVEEGALDECARFAALGLSLASPAGRALGAAELTAHLEGRLTLAEASAAAVLATRRYAKRQRTWFRNRMAGWPRLDATAPDALDQIARS